MYSQLTYLLFISNNGQVDNHKKYNELIKLQLVEKIDNDEVTLTVRGSVMLEKLTRYMEELCQENN